MTTLTGDVLLATIVFLPLPAAVAGYWLGRKDEAKRDLLVLTTIGLTLVLTLLLTLYHPDAELRLGGSGDLALHLMLDGFRAIYACISGLMWLVTAIFSLDYFAHSKTMNRYWFFNLLTLGATLGMFLSGNLFTAFLFFEVISFTSSVLVVHDESPAALRATETYLAVAIIGGLTMLMGLLLLSQQAGTLEFAQLYKACRALDDKSSLYLPGILLLVGFGAKAGMFPLHIWLPKAHPVAPAPASALLSGILTKVGIFGVAAISCAIFLHDPHWALILLFPASATMLLGAVLGLFSNDLKRTLACSSVSQIGFILLGIAMQGLLGEHNSLAVRGSLLHMVNHSLIKLVLFTTAGLVYMNCHELHLNKIRGFGRGKPLFLFLFLMGGLSLSGVPLWSGYISKTLLHESIVEAIHLFQGLPAEFFMQLLEALFLFSGGLTVAYMTKLFVALFVEKGDSVNAEAPYINRRSAAVLGASAVLLPLMGSLPSIMDALADMGEGFFHGHAPSHSVEYFAWINLQGAVISVAIGATIYLFFVRGLLMRRQEDGRKIYVDLWPKWLDLEDSVYRPLLNHLVRGLTFVAGAFAEVTDSLMRLAKRTVLRPIKKPYTPGRFLLRHYRLLFPQQPPLPDEPAVAGSFSLSLLFAGIGVSLVLIYLLQRFWLLT